MASLNLPGNFNQMLSSLFQKLGANLSGLDYEEQDKRRKYEQGLYSLGQERPRAMQSSSTNMADRGLNRSGIALQQHTDVNNSYDTKGAGLAQDFSSSLSDIARKRLQAKIDYDLQQAELERQAALGR